MEACQIGADRWHFEATAELRYPVVLAQRTEVFFDGDAKGESVYSAWPQAAFREDGSHLEGEDPISDAAIIRYLIPFDYSSNWLLENGLGPGFKLGLTMLGALREPLRDPLGWLTVIRLNPDWPGAEERIQRPKRVRRRRPPPEESAPISP